MRTWLIPFILSLLGTGAVSCGGRLAGDISCKSDADCPRNAYCRVDLCVIDKDGPIISIDSPDPTRALSSEKVIITGTATDTEQGAGVVRIEYSVDGGTYEVLPTQGPGFSFEIDVPEADYVPLDVLVQATDRIGHVSVLRTTFYADRIGPTIDLQVPERIRYGVADCGTTLTITGTAQDGSGTVASTQVSFDGGLTWTETQSPTEIVHDRPIECGERGAALVVKMKSVDGSGNLSEAQSGVISIDTVLPEVTVNEPTEDTLIGQTDTGDLTVSGTYVELNPISLEASIAGGESVDLDYQDGKFRGTVPLTNEDETNRTLKVTLRDVGGNAATTTITFTHDSIAPRISTALQDEMPLMQTDPGDYLLGVYVEDRGDIDLRATVDGVTAVVNSLGRTDDIWAFEVAIPIQREDHTRHTLELASTDAAGNVATRALRYWVDNVAPIFQVAFENDTLINLASSLPIIVSGVVDDRGLTRLTLSIDGQAASDLAVVDGAFSFPLPIQEEDWRSHRFELGAHDAGGGVASLARTYLVDRKAPVLALGRHGPNGTTIARDDEAAISNRTATSYRFTGTVSDAKLKTPAIMMRVRGQNITGTLTAGDWTTDWTGLSALGDVELSETVTITATDSGGNATTVTKDVFIDRVVPIANLVVNNRRGILANDVLVTFSETMNASSVIAASQFKINGTSVPSTALVANSDERSFYASYTGRFPAFSTIELTIGDSARDVAGNTLAAAVQESFRTGGDAPGASTVACTNCLSAMLAEGPDGVPIIAATRLGAAIAIRWDGYSWVESGVIANMQSPANEARIADFRSDPTFSELSVDLNGEVLIAEKRSTAPTLEALLYASSSNDFSRWSSSPALSMEVTATSTQGTGAISGSAFSPHVNYVDNYYPLKRVRILNLSTWSYTDLGPIPSGSTAFAYPLAVGTTAQDLNGPTDLGGPSIKPGSAAAAFLSNGLDITYAAWSGCTADSPCTPALEIRCKETATSRQWMPVDAASLPTSEQIKSIAIRHIAINSRLGTASKTVGLAISTTASTSYFTTHVGPCPAKSPIVWSGAAIPNSKSPSVAPGPNGTWYISYLDTATPGTVRVIRR